MKPRKQRLHSAELRRLDHIAQSLERIAAALERMHPINGNDNVVLEQIGGNNNRLAGNNNNTSTIHGNGSIQYENSDSFNTNSNEAIKNLTSALK